MSKVICTAVLAGALLLGSVTAQASSPPAAKAEAAMGAQEEQNSPYQDLKMYARLGVAYAQMNILTVMDYKRIGDVEEMRRYMRIMFDSRTEYSGHLMQSLGAISASDAPAPVKDAARQVLVTWEVYVDQIIMSSTKEQADRLAGGPAATAHGTAVEKFVLEARLAGLKI